jgi:hypothetical protein
MASPDPVHVAIAAHRRAMAAYEAALDISAAMAAGDPAFPPASAVTQRAFTALEASGVRLLEVAPTTLPGLAALLAYIAECAIGEDGVWRLPDRLVDHGGEYERARPGEDLDRAEPFAHFVISTAAATIKRLAEAPAVTNR